jgi:hypothetical protein
MIRRYFFHCANLNLMYNFRADHHSALPHGRLPLRLLQSLNVVGLAGTITINALANGLPINGKTTGELSGQYPNLFTPAGLTFSIWGLIYLLLSAFCVYQAQGLFQRQPRRARLHVAGRIGFLFFVSCIANIAWILAWHYEYVAASVGIMAVLFFSLLQIYLRLNHSPKSSSWQEKYLARLPFSVYLGWISVASIANVTAWLVDAGWGRGAFSEEALAVTMVGAAALIGLYLLLKQRDVAFALVIAWALIGILTKRLQTSGGAFTFLIGVTVFFLLLVSTGVIWAFFHPLKSVPPMKWDAEEQ